MERTDGRDAPGAVDPGDAHDGHLRSADALTWDAAALGRLEQALEVIGAHCASIGVRILRAHQPPRGA